jgi:hypothetical protein
LATRGDDPDGGAVSNTGYQHLGRDGVFSRAEALDLGETDKSLARARRAGVIVRLRRGRYVSAETYSACDERGKHLLRARAALDSQLGEAVLAGVSAAALYGFDLYDQDLSDVHLLRMDGVKPHNAASTNHHAVTLPITDNDVHVVGGIRLVSPARAVWEVACRSSLEGGVVTADSALRLDPSLGGPLAELAARFAFVPGSRQARAAINLADGRAESPGESVTRVQFHRYRIPMPELQYAVVNHRGEVAGEADFYWEDARHLGEFDGKVKYLKFLRAGESPSDCVFREKRREDSMRAGLRGMSRFTWADVMPQRARRTMEDLAHALEESRRLYVRGRVIIGS